MNLFAEYLVVFDTFMLHLGLHGLQFLRSWKASKFFANPSRADLRQPSARAASLRVVCGGPAVSKAVLCSDGRQACLQSAAAVLCSVVLKACL